MTRAWTLPTLFVLPGALVAAALFLRGGPGGAVVPLLASVVFAGVYSPLAFPRSTSAAEAQRRSALDGRPVVYWRSGCRYCLRLRRRLGRAGRPVEDRPGQGLRAIPA
ncbi:hypothetical protein ACFRK5_22915 [Streptomyces niveus]|uniref:hypothetical protein n=1 Tax=Streptomyces niveus TaxID=193462 RepID=UPI003691FFA7